MGCGLLARVCAHGTRMALLTAYDAWAGYARAHLYEEAVVPYEATVSVNCWLDFPYLSRAGPCAILLREGHVLWVLWCCEDVDEYHGVIWQSSRSRCGVVLGRHLILIPLM